MLIDSSRGTMYRDIFVFAHLDTEKPVIAGVLRYDESGGLGSFRYANSYVSRADALPISIQPGLIELSSTVITETNNQGLPGPIRDSLPDYWGRLVFASRMKIPAEKVSNVDLLLSPIPERFGFLDFSDRADRCPTPSAPVVIPVLEHLDALIEVAEALQENRKLNQQEEWAIALLAQGTSLGGARPKSVIRDNGELWLAKFPTKDDRYDVCGVEFATHAMANELGIRVPEAKLSAFPDGRRIFLTKRFDRDSQGRRLPALSALSALGLDESENALGSYPAIARILQKLGDTHGRQELFKRMVFNAGIRNTDDHLRNHCILYSRAHSAWNLSPGFDINPGIKRTGIGEQFNLSIGIGKHGRSVTAENLLSSVTDFGLTEKEGKQIIGDVANVLSRWREHFASAKIDNGTMELFSETFLSGQKMLRECLSTSVMLNRKHPGVKPSGIE